MVSSGNYTESETSHLEESLVLTHTLFATSSLHWAKGSLYGSLMIAGEAQYRTLNTAQHDLSPVIGEATSPGLWSLRPAVETHLAQRLELSVVQWKYPKPSGYT